MPSFKTIDIAFIGYGAFVGLLTAILGKFGVLTAASAVPTFAVILGCILVGELVVGYIKGIPPASLISFQTRFMALAAGVLLDVALRSGLGW
jgi:hypothetical protein